MPAVQVTTTQYSLNDGYKALDAYAWHHGTIQQKISPRPVATKNPNPWGLYDIYGNMWEFCSDWHAPYLQDDALDPKGPKTGTHRVLRGGAWMFEPAANKGAYFRSAARYKEVPERGTYCYGFRVVLGFE